MTLSAWFSRFRLADPFAFVSAILLSLIGLSAIYAAVLSQPNTAFLDVKKQGAALLVGIIVFFVMANANYRQLRSYSNALYLLGIFLLLAVLFVGATINGARGWFSFGPFTFQPAEPMKIFLAASLAAYFSQYAKRVLGWREIVGSLLIMAVPALLIIKEPDLGSAIVLVAIWGAMLLFAGLPKRSLAVLLLFGALVGIGGWHFALAPYQKARIAVFLNPTTDPLGQGYNVTQAIIAVGSGGWTGRGLGFGTQSQLRFLPESQTDFIFAVIAEAFGFLGAAFVLGLWLFLLLRLLRTARRSTDGFAIYLLVGFGASLLIQVVIHVGMNIGVMPVTGLPLPLVSYGGSSLIFTFMMLGIAENIARSAKRTG